MITIDTLTQSAIKLLKNLIETPSFSSEEDPTALLLERWFQRFEIPYNRYQNNVWATNKSFDTAKPTLLLNSHHDTVKPNSGYIKNPFDAHIEDGKLYGLGSNDAGGCLVSLLATFTYFYDRDSLAYNLVFVGSAEEESSGPNGLNSMLSIVPKIDVAIVGEPTQMHLAVAEKGLVVFDVEVSGTPSHAAHPNDNNALYNAIPVMEWIKNYQFEQESEALGRVKMTLTQINAGQQHNAVPAKVVMVVDVRVNDCYSNAQIVALLQEHLPNAKVTARSTNLNSSRISKNHPLVQAGIELGRETYGSPTLSDQAVLSCPSLKLGPGDSTRSHTADEFIYVHEIEEGIALYIQLLNKIL
jgi:acetylornithine deacetylase